MAVTIGSNILSQTVQRNLSRSSEALSSASERLSSGQRINKASDDAAGLSISMSLDKDRILARTAQRNISDGISMISIMGAGLSSQKEILFRMAELAEQSANGTYSNEQRSVLQKEYSSLMDEFDRIGESVEFNGIKLLRNRGGETVQLMAGITGADTSLLQVAAVNSHRFAGRYSSTANLTNNQFIDIDDLAAFDELLKGDNVSSVSNIDISNAKVTFGTMNVQNSSGRSTTVSFLLAPVINDFNTTVPLSTPPPASYDVVLRAIDSSGGLLENFQFGAYSPGQQSLTIGGTLSNGAIFSLGLDLSGFEIASIDRVGVADVPSNIGFTNVISRGQSRRSLDTVTNRISDISALEGRIGAVESRLRTAQSVLASSGENFAAASSRIRDADVAAESANVVRAQILQQSAASLLGQANLAPQIGLQLLQNA